MTMIEIREPLVLSNKGQKIFGVLHIPDGIKKPPCVLICHGLGGNKVGHYRAYVDLAEALIKKQIAVLRFDFRGSGDSEGTFDEMTLEGEVSDALAMLEYLKSDARLDSTRIGIFGRSLGGAVAVLSAAEAGLLKGVSIKCLTLWAPIFNGDPWKQQWAKVKNQSVSEKESRDMRRINGQVASVAFYTELFDMQIDPALKKLDNVPLLLIHGEKDTLMAIHHSELYLEARGHSCDQTRFIRLPQTDHDFSNTEERAQAIEQTVQWFEGLLH